ncbi:D-alanine--D-alanine ligase [Algivirga pacifica]|uniref:D-alanine--D-alanine ligase n=1 Tax=Algivirga pacifica TaxID=1162670 RepID=A0ABP9DFY5_9BACT
MKKNVAVVMGGYSSEYVISMQSGNVIYNHVDREKFTPYRVVIERKSWYVLLEDETKIEIDKNDFSFILDGAKVTFDVAYNVIHGTPGEDGKLPGYWDMLEIPYTSCAPFEAALTFNKRECIAVARQYNIPTAESVFLSAGDQYDTQEIIDKVGLPCFVKPNRAGSSFGVSKVKEAAQLPEAIAVALKEDSQILIESFLDGVEVSVGTMKKEGEIFVFPMTEIRTENEFFDFQAKYEGGAQEITPAEVPDNVTQTVRELAAKVYKAMNLRGIVRTDFIIVDGKPNMLEINTIPGMSTESILPQQARYLGISLEELVTFALESTLHDAVSVS